MLQANVLSVLSLRINKRDFFNLAEATEKKRALVVSSLAEMCRLSCGLVGRDVEVFPIDDVVRFSHLVYLHVVEVVADVLVGEFFVVGFANCNGYVADEFCEV